MQFLPPPLHTKNKKEKCFHFRILKISLVDTLYNNLPNSLSHSFRHLSRPKLSVTNSFRMLVHVNYCPSSDHNFKTNSDFFLRTRPSWKCKLNVFVPNEPLCRLSVNLIRVFLENCRCCTFMYVCLLVFLAFNSLNCVESTGVCANVWQTADMLPNRMHIELVKSGPIVWVSPPGLTLRCFFRLRRPQWRG